MYSTDNIDITGSREIIPREKKIGDLINAKRAGSILINTIFIIIFMIAIGFMMMQWAADDAFRTRYKLAEAQAYHVADVGIFKELLPELGKNDIESASNAVIHGQSGTYFFKGSAIGNYSDVVGYKVSDRVDQQSFNDISYYDLES
ncbi:hypothetical protein K8I28_10010 [bacterium]|nr:hypothetical protein [bacterium]